MIKYGISAASNNSCSISSIITVPRRLLLYLFDFGLDVKLKNKIKMDVGLSGIKVVL